ncbi:zinc-ribbon domain-containing protein [Pseudochryseolinea flava]|uniref:Zinc-ribbon 15 domain-containing protein n=1 Tax=Pseudochryseolinea flava TaxID=2059302 RepID=A0A364XWJ9_9BACT|nr:zinc-ribbon domain-containing protein [Pseudochryseolinea flava]RAV97895.1 hypothetical protein DQQ10_26430 [Pseudochryseolinea flava]
MIIYGKRASHLKSVVIPNVACPNCKAENTIVLGTFSQYVHIFWIPVFSIGRTGISQCSNCKQSFEGSQLPLDFRAAYNNLLKETRIPIFHFIGAALIGTAILYGMYSSGETAKREADYFANPQKGDNYAVKIEDGYYTTFKVDSVASDTLYVYWNNMAVDKVTGLYKIRKDENYATEREAVVRTYLSELKTSNKIHEIVR